MFFLECESGLSDETFSTSISKDNKYSQTRNSFIVPPDIMLKI